MRGDALDAPPANPAEPSASGAAAADVCLVLEGTYPYVAGGVSSWVHQILGALPERRFALLHIGPHPGAFGEPRYTVPDNVTALCEIFCQGVAGAPLRVGRPPRPPRRAAVRSRVLSALERLHLSGEVDDALVADLASNDLSVQEFLHGDDSFAFICALYEELTPGAPFTEVFWHLRAMHIPLLRLLAAPAPAAAAYHAVSTGYAGAVGAVASVRTGRPLLVTEHGLYAREREMELARAPWINDGAPVDVELGEVTLSPLRRLWSRYFRALSRVAYHQATQLITLSEVNRAKQIADGADPARIEIVPNGVELELYAEAAAARARRPARRGTMRVGFVGRVVPIKDVLTLLRATSLALHQLDLEVWVVGPQDEDPDYARRCTDLVDKLGLADVVRFLGPQPVREIYPQLDALWLTSLSEGQPLVILEAHAAGLPVIATDVGACRELLCGCPGDDAALGPSGLVTPVANPTAIADALIALGRDPPLRARMGLAGLARVRARYQLADVIRRYDAIYREAAAWPASAGS